MEHLNSGFHNFKVNDSTHIKNVDSSKNVKKHTKPFKYNCKILNRKLIYYNKCKMQFVNNDFNILKMNNSIHVHMLMIEKMWKNHEFITI